MAVVSSVQSPCWGLGGGDDSVHAKVQIHIRRPCPEAVGCWIKDTEKNALVPYRTSEVFQF